MRIYSTNVLYRGVEKDMNEEEGGGVLMSLACCASSSYWHTLPLHYAKRLKAQRVRICKGKAGIR